MNEISVNQYFNIENPWTKRLLGDVDFKKNRTITQIENEYNLDKYAKLLMFNFKTINEYKEKEFEQAGLDPVKGELSISKGDSIFKTTVLEARKQYYELIKAGLKKYTSTNICELGCGYGFNLSYLGDNAYGGEYSINAVNLAQQLGYEVSAFNYYNESDYNFIKPNSTVITVHSIEQIPDATTIIQSLEKQKDKINFVVHFEPTIVKTRNSLLGLFRNKYLEMNDYNSNLIELLSARKDIEIIELKTDIFGLVPLNSTNLIVWKFKK